MVRKNILKVRSGGVFPFKHEMQIRLNSEIPFHCAPRRLSYYEREKVAEIIDGLLVDGVIRPCDSPYGYVYPIVIVRKKCGALRMCVDYRALNKLTARDNYPLPLIEDCIEYLDGKTCFSLLDLKSGFHQVEMEDGSIKYSSFVTPHDQFKYI